MIWYSHLFQNFPQFIVIHTVKGFGIANKAVLKFKLEYICIWIIKCEIPDVQAGFRKGRGTKDQIANICWIIKKSREFHKTSISALLTMPKPLTVWITINCGKFWKRWECQSSWPASWEICMQVRKQQLELDMEQQTGSKSGKEYVKGVNLPFFF